jgi:serine/threonine-protein kinase
MSPEQMGGHTIGVPSDVYAAGLLLFELITGSPYHQSDDLLTISKSYTDEQPEWASDRIRQSITAGDSITRFRASTDRQLVRRVKRDIDWILSKALAPRAQDRYAGMDAILADINSTLAGQPISAGRPTVSRRLKAFCHANRLFFLGMFAAGTLLLELAAFSQWYNSRDHQPTVIKVEQPGQRTPQNSGPGQTSTP